MCQSTVRSQYLEKGRLESGTAYQNIKSNTVIKNTYTMRSVRRNNADISSMQRMGNSLDRGKKSHPARKNVCNSEIHFWLIS